MVSARMALVAYIVAVVLYVVPAHAWPEQWYPQDIRFPTQIKLPTSQVRMPEPQLRLPDSLPFSIRLPNELPPASEERDAIRCCRAMTAECLACSAQQDVTQFCADTRHVRITGCGRALKKAVQAKGEEILDGVFNEVVDTATEEIGRDAVETVADHFVESHPGMAQKNLASLTSDALNAISSLKHSFFSPRPGLSAPIDAVASSEPTLLDDVKPDIKPDSSDKTDQREAMLLAATPWIIATGAMLVTTICSGIAVGALCHARLQRHAREPLLSTLLQDVEPTTSHAGLVVDP